MLIIHLSQPVPQLIIARRDSLTSPIIIIIIISSYLVNLIFQLITNYVFPPKRR